MPLYTYKCEECGYTKEELLPVEGIDIVFECYCGGLLRRDLSQPGRPVFRGDGFHDTDYTEKRKTITEE